LPEALSWDDGVDVGQMGPICVNAVAFGEDEFRDTPAVVFGAGPVGLLTAQIAKAEGAERVYLVDRIGSRLEVAASLGLEPIEANGDDIAVLLKRRHGSEGIAVAFECTGSSAALHEAIRTVKRRGLVVAAGFYQGDSIGLRLGEEFHHNGIRVISGQIGNVHPSFDWPSLRARVVELAQSGRVIFGGLPRAFVAVDDIAIGMKELTHPERILQVALTY
jgi:threonine dehydrogenase-like Zn-dependent dehydrogenase